MFLLSLFDPPDDEPAVPTITAIRHGPRPAPDGLDDDEGDPFVVSSPATAETRRHPDRVTLAELFGDADEAPARPRPPRHVREL